MADLRCYKCNELLPTSFVPFDRDSWYSVNVAPNAASGGIMMPVHHRCWPSPLQVTDTPTRAEVEALKMRPVRRKHVFHGPEDHANSWESDSCQACVLSLCKVCRGAEASLPTDCPGRKMTCEEEDAVQNGTLDFVRDCWVVPRAYAATLPPQATPERACWFCGTEITACFGFTLARDILPFLKGEAQSARELCGKCVEKIESLVHPEEVRAANAQALPVASKPTPRWPGPGPEPTKWTAEDGTIVYRSYEDYCDD